MPDCTSPKPPGNSAPAPPSPGSDVAVPGTALAVHRAGCPGAALAGPGPVPGPAGPVAGADGPDGTAASAGAAPARICGGQPVRTKRLAGHDRPLPDAVAIHSITVPRTAPPYDDDRPAAGARRAAVSNSARTDRAVRARAVRAPVPGTGAAEAHPPGRDPAARWPSQFAQVLAETLAGSRPPSQIAPWTTEQARKRIGQLGPMLATAHRPRIKRVIVTSPSGGVLEMAVIVGMGTRVRALAVRLERASLAAAAASAGPPTAGESTDQAQLPGGPFATSRPRPGPADPSKPTSSWLCTAIEAA
jgi:hypothetical protein